jgi:hypothetical protein
VDAESSFDALEKAHDCFETNYMRSPIKELNDISTVSDVVNSWSLDGKSTTENDELKELLESVINQFPDTHESLKKAVAMLAEREKQQ